MDSLSGHLAGNAVTQAPVMLKASEKIDVRATTTSEQFNDCSVELFSTNFRNTFTTK